MFLPVNTVQLMAKLSIKSNKFISKKTKAIKQKSNQSFKNKASKHAKKS